MSKHVATYPTEDQFREWQADASDMGMSMSNFVEMMVEGGRKKIQPEFEVDTSNAELREQRADLRRELERTRDRVEELENRLHKGERSAVLQYIEESENPTFGNIQQQLQNTTRERLVPILEQLEGEEIVEVNGVYARIPTDGGDE